MTIQRRRFLQKMAAGAAVLSTGIPLTRIYGQPSRKLGVALVGLGYYSTDLLAPALQLTEYCELRGIVTGSKEKIPVWQERYGISDRNVYSYENMHEVADNDAIDVIYIVLPPSLHTKYSVIAAEAGKHVWCEKPMARTAAECQTIIDACRKNKRYLSIGYRMQHEPNTRQIMKWAETRPYGNIISLSAEAGYREGRTSHWKLNKEMGGGAMYDMGVYPLNAVRYATNSEPLSVKATYEYTRPEIFSKADEITHFQLTFPGGVQATCKTSLAESLNTLHVDCKNGWYELSPFQSYTGIQGTTSDGKVLNQNIPNQQARQMDDDALAILRNTEVLVPGEEGLKDIRIVEAIHQSAMQNGREITL
ncbi:Gfo/Idh/MocA family protein [Fulvivirga sedimenti]|uniref:Gfo/Idh/MocA family oxidoreductase n=1 Tax=Fulvivirga sedimenti TaxID=2879465 RepID=A0A9X1HVA2_9BACT|nr:Gfo/Idh/MocA family oxidoreductase [Fulvivirga sedimenti]MCA6074547.1 Gfo/Idh/MocA family oxidoreductase [Fulvivirga sedimenti]MCA6075724.1 Gfo/Idh/MocA family oxidoreductase [Fulvivirga sedimenti]MCA6076852.1 Gfo/Idh/MocA family oxidoreductase [Fulvivirga sedimenti]